LADHDPGLAGRLQHPIRDLVAPLGAHLSSDRRSRLSRPPYSVTDHVLPLRPGSAETRSPATATSADSPLLNIRAKDRSPPTRALLDTRLNNRIGAKPEAHTNRYELPLSAP